MSHITAMRARQLCTLIRGGADIAELASAQRVPIERIKAVVGKEVLKEGKKAAKEAAVDPVDPETLSNSAVDDFS